MVSVPVKIEATSIGDRWSRHQGMAIDEPLVRAFWTDQPGTLIGISGAKSFSFEKELELKSGIHTIEYGNGSYCKSHVTYGDLSWKATITVGGKVVGSSNCVGRDAHLVTQFYLGPKGRVRSIPGLRKPLIPKIKLLTRIKGIFTRQRNQNLREGLKPR